MKIADKWVPREINESQRVRSFEGYSLLHLQNLNNPFIDKIVNCDEKCIPGANRKLSSQWFDKGERHNNFPKSNLNQQKSMVTFW